MADATTTPAQAAAPAPLPTLLAATAAEATPPANTSQGTAGEAPDTAASAKDGKTEEAPKEAAPDSTMTEETKASDAAAELVLTLPEGVAADDAMVQSFTATAKELGLKSDAAQKVLDVYIQHAKKEAEATNTFLEKQREEWVKAVTEDKEIGGPALKQSIAFAQRGLEKFASPELRQYLEDTGLGNNPHLVKLFAKVGRAMAEDRFAGMGQQDVRTAEEKLLAQLYPKTKFSNQK